MSDVAFNYPDVELQVVGVSRAERGVVGGHRALAAVVRPVFRLQGAAHSFGKYFENLIIFSYPASGGSKSDALDFGSSPTVKSRVRLTDFILKIKLHLLILYLFYKMFSPCWL